MRRKIIFVSTLAAIAGFSAIAQGQLQIFSDTFENGIPADSDGITRFWTVENPTNTTVEEAGGVLINTAGGLSSPAGTIASRLRSGAPDQRCNFFRQTLQFSADVSLGGTIASSQSYMRFVLTGSDTNNYLAEDAFSLRFSADNNVTISRKQDRSPATAESVKTLASGNVGSSITGFSLTLDGTNYTAIVYHTGAAGSTPFSGAHGLVAAQWGIDGASAFQFETLRVPSSGQGAGLDAVTVIDNFRINRMQPGPIVLEDSFGDGIVSNSDFVSGFWVAQLPSTSTAVENGNMILAARSPDSGNIRATLMSAVSTNFNFFDRQLKFSADTEVSGNNSTWLSRVQFSLASVSTNGVFSPDVLMVSLGQNQQASFYRKLNAASVAPDASNAAVTKLFDATPYGNGDFNRFELTLNTNRYLMKTFNAGNASGIMRVSGEHGVSRDQWGTSGDSAILLETYRSGGAENTVTTGTWDNVAVEADTIALLAEPHIDFQATYDTTGAHDYRLWIPSTEKTVRGVIFIGPGSGGDARYMANDPVAQDAARAIGFALIGYQNAGNMKLWSNSSSSIQPAVQAVLDTAADVSGHPEIANAPLCITGLSAGAFDSSYLARNWPDRVISFVCHRGNDFSNPTLSSAAKKVPGLMVAGSLDVNSLTSPLAMKTRFSSWRSQGAQVAFAVDWKVGHTMRGNQGWEATFAWFVEVANLRYPRPLAPSVEDGGGWPQLISLADNSGWLGDNASFSAATTPSVTSSFAAIAPYADYSGTVSAASWMPNEACARIYRALTSTDLASRSVVPLQGYLRITSPAQYADPVPVGQPVSIELDPREFDNTNALVEVDFYDGEVLLGTVTNGPDWSLSFTPVDTGMHALSVVATDTLGNSRDAFRTLVVVPEDFPPYANNEDKSVAADSSLNGTVTGFDPEGAALTYTVQQFPTNGTLSLQASSGEYIYQPVHGYSGPDSFVFVPVSSGTTGTAVTASISVSSLVDTNANGLPDEWEAQYNVSNPDLDGDGDGFSNLQEYLALTDPANASDFPKVQAMISSSSEAPFTLQWPARGSVRYRIQYSDDLSSGWTDIPRSLSEEVQPGDSGVAGTASFVDDWTLTPPPASSHRFYRIRIL